MFTFLKNITHTNQANATKFTLRRMVTFSHVLQEQVQCLRAHLQHSLSELFASIRTEQQSIAISHSLVINHKVEGQLFRKSADGNRLDEWQHQSTMNIAILPTEKFIFSRCYSTTLRTAFLSRLISILCELTRVTVCDIRLIRLSNSPYDKSHKIGYIQC